MLNKLNETDEIEKELNIDPFTILMILLNAMDLINISATGHHIRVAYISYKIAKECGLEKKRIDKLVGASCIHDMGALALGKSNIEYNFESDGKHEKLCYYFTKESKFFSEFSDIIKYHHRDWNNARDNDIKVPIESYIIHLADRIDSYIDKKKPVLPQVNYIVSKINEESGKYFNPEHVEAFNKIAKNESFWLYLLSNSLPDLLKKETKLNKVQLSIQQFRDIARWFSYFIDFDSNFTSIHSVGVGFSARIIAEKMKLPNIEIDLIETSGYLHDIGKLVVPNNILEKNGKLDDVEYAIVKSHPFYTYSVVKNVKAFKRIIKYASYHHEHIDGTGYPFHIKGKKLLTGCRIICIADTITALIEDRPYRKGMERSEVIKILEKLGNDKHLDSQITKIAIDNLEIIEKRILEAEKFQKETSIIFWNQMNWDGEIF